MFLCFFYVVHNLFLRAKIPMSLVAQDISKLSTLAEAALSDQFLKAVRSSISSWLLPLLPDLDIVFDEVRSAFIWLLYLTAVQRGFSFMDLLALKTPLTYADIALQQPSIMVSNRVRWAAVRLMVNGVRLISYG
jgi:hypothetical protein